MKTVETRIRSDEIMIAIKQDSVAPAALMLLAILSWFPGLVSYALAEQAYRVTDQPLTLDIHFHSENRHTYNSDWPVEKRATELTGISLRSVTAPDISQSADAFNALIASGYIPDIVGGSGLKDSFNQYGQKGAFLPLTDLIDQHAPNIAAFFEKRPDIRAAITAANGELYYIPYLPDGQFGRMYFIRQDWLEKLDLETPTTVDELYTVLKAFRERDPNGNNKKDEIPFFSRDWEEIVRLVVFWDARTTGSDTFHEYYVNDGRIVHGYAEESFKAAIRNVAQWYAEGLIDPEFLTRGKKAREILFAGNLGGMTHDWYPSTTSYNVSVADEVPGFLIKAMAPPASPTGRQLEEHRVIPVKPGGWAIGHTNQYPIETIKYFDFWFTEIGRRLANFGVEGQHYDMVDGLPYYKPEILNARVPVNTQMRGIGAQIQRGYPQDFRYQQQWTNEMGLEAIALYEKGDYLIEQFLGVAMIPEEQNIYNKYHKNLRSYMLEKLKLWVLGTEDVETGWDAYQSKLEELGYSKVIKVMQSAYDRQNVSE